MAKSMRWQLTPSWTLTKLNRTTTTGSCARLTLHGMGLYFLTTQMQLLTTGKLCRHTHMNRTDKYHITVLTTHRHLIKLSIVFLWHCFCLIYCAKRFQARLQPECWTSINQTHRRVCRKKHLISLNTYIVVFRQHQCAKGWYWALWWFG